MSKKADAASKKGGKSADGVPEPPDTESTKPKRKPKSKPAQPQTMHFDSSSLAVVEQAKKLDFCTNRRQVDQKVAIRYQNEVPITRATDGAEVMEDWYLGTVTILANAHVWVEIVGEEEFQPTKLVTKESTYDKGWVYVEALDESIVQSLRTRLAREAKQRLKKVKAAEEAVKKAKSSAKVKSSAAQSKSGARRAADSSDEDSFDSSNEEDDEESDEGLGAEGESEDAESESSDADEESED